MQMQTRHGYGTTIPLLHHVLYALLGNDAYRSCVKDWIYGVIYTRRTGDSSTVIEAETTRPWLQILAIRRC